jgi:hypothetical protein
MTLTILSHAEDRKAIVTETDDGIRATYYRRTTNDGWVYLRTTVLPGPFHLALDTVHQIVNA